MMTVRGRGLILGTAFGLGLLLTACNACDGLYPRGWAPSAPIEKMVVHYSIRIQSPESGSGRDLGTASRTMEVTDAETLRLAERTFAKGFRHNRICSCKYDNWIAINRADAAGDNWHFCHSATQLGVYGDDLTISPELYQVLKRRATAEAGQPAALMCHNEEFGE